MTRRLSLVLAGISTLAWLLTLVLWISGFWSVHNFVVGRYHWDDKIRTERNITLRSSSTQFVVNYWVFDSRVPLFNFLPLDPPRGFRTEHWADPAPAFSLLPGNGDGPIWNRIGFRYYDSKRAEAMMDGHSRMCSVPFWFPLVVFAAWPAITLAKVAQGHRKERRVRRGLCGSCGYDLRATPDRCPECGAVPERVSTSTEPHSAR